MAYLHNEPNVIIHRDLKPRWGQLLVFLGTDMIGSSFTWPSSRNVLLVNSNADHLKVGDFGLSKLIKVQNSHDVYKMTGETGSCECYIYSLEAKYMHLGVCLYMCTYSNLNWLLFLLREWKTGTWHRRYSGIGNMTKRLMSSHLPWYCMR